MSDYETVPQALKNRPNWIVWRLEERDGKETKVPYDAKTGQFAKSNNPSTWANFEQAADSVVESFLNERPYNGIGICHSDDLASIDCDGVLRDGKLEPYIASILKLLGDTYCEITPSGTGVRPIFRGRWPKGKKRKFDVGEHHGIELFDSSSARYITVTGDRFSGKDILAIDDATLELVQFLVSQYPDEKFKRSWLGDSSDHNNDTSRGDEFLAGHLARNFSSDPKKIDAAFRLSKRMRPKWDELHHASGKTYGQGTIDDVTKTAYGIEPAKPSPQAPVELVFHLPAVTTDRDDEYVINPAPGQPDGWFPLGSVSMVAGLSGTNKSTLMIQLLNSQRAGLEFWGHTTNRRPYLIVMADRGRKSHTRTMRRMGLAPDGLPIKFIPIQTGTAGLQNIVDKIEEMTPLPQIVFVEGADMLVDDCNKKQIVATFMNNLRKIAEQYNIAVIVSVGAPKSKIGEGYIEKRSQVAGTEAWGRLSETIMVLQYSAGNDMKLERELSVLPRNAAPEGFALIFDGGRLRLRTDADVQIRQDEMLEWVQQQDQQVGINPAAKWWTAAEMELALDKTHTKVWRWLQVALEKRWITEQPGKKKGRGGAGFYQWNKATTNPLVRTEPETENVQGTLESEI